MKIKCNNIVCITGLDGCGKSTQMDYIVAWLDKIGIAYEHIRLQDVIVPKNIILKSSMKYIKENHIETNPEIVDSIFLGYRTKYIMENIIAPLLHKKKLLFVERYIESDLLYLKYQKITNVYYMDILCNYYIPRICIYLSVPAKCCYQRIINRGNLSDHENPEYLKLSEEFFLSIIDRFDYVIDGCKDAKDIFCTIQKIIYQLLNDLEDNNK